MIAFLVLSICMIGLIGIPFFGFAAIPAALAGVMLTTLIAYTD